MATGTREELMELLWAAARRGNVPAMRILLLDMDRTEDSEEPGSVIDELAKRRVKASG